MRASLLVCVALVGCSSGSNVTHDSGAALDGGVAFDGGCRGVPDRLGNVECREDAVATCEANANAMMMRYLGFCPLSGYRGGRETKACGGYSVVAYTAAAPSADTARTTECFYEFDGPLVGALNHFDGGTTAWGAVADCNRTEPIPCADGCVGLPESVGNHLNCSPDVLSGCHASADEQRAAHAGICQADGPYTGGQVTRVCGAFEVVTQKTCCITRQCFYDVDGGALTGAFVRNDTTDAAWGRLTECRGPESLECEEVCSPYPAGVRATCVAASRFDNCGSNFANVNIPVTVDCDAGLGHAAEGSCGDVKAIRWTSGATRECFYAVDGGAFVGAFDFTGGGVFATGTTASCTWRAPDACP